MNTQYKQGRKHWAKNYKEAFIDTEREVNGKGVTWYTDWYVKKCDKWVKGSDFRASEEGIFEDILIIIKEVLDER